MIIQLISFLTFTLLVAGYATYRLKGHNLSTQDGFFLAGRSLTGMVIAGSLLLTNISTEHLIGMNGSAYKNGAIIISYEISSAIALVVAALFFAPRYLKLGLSTIPEFLEKRFDGMTRTIVAGLLIISFVMTILPIVLYTGALNIESLFDISAVLGVSKSIGLWVTIFFIGVIGGIYAIYGGLKMVAITDTINGIALLLIGFLVPILACHHIGDGDIIAGLTKVYNHAPEKFKVISSEPSIGPGSRSAILPASVLITGFIINQLYFWAMHQSIIQRVFGAIDLKEAQKGLLFAGLLKILIPIVVILPGIIGFYYYGDSLFENQDAVYPLLVKKVMPFWLTGFFVAVMLGAVLSTFNSVLNSAATVFSLGFYKRFFKKQMTGTQTVIVGKWVSFILAGFSIIVAPFVGNAPDGLFQLLQQLNGIFFIPMASIILAGFLLPQVSATGAKAGLTFGLIFYVFSIYIFKLDIHFIHIWGIEFVLNILIMIIVSKFYPMTKTFSYPEDSPVDLTPWKYRYRFSFFLVISTLAIYVLLR